MLWDRQAAYVATELQSTNNLLVNETLLSIPDQMRSWKRNSQMLPMPRQIEVMQFSIPNVEYIAVANLDTSIIGFGYSNEFLDFSDRPIRWPGPHAFCSLQPPTWLLEFSASRALPVAGRSVLPCGQYA